MVADVQGWLNDPATNFGWVPKSDEIQDIGIYIASSEATTRIDIQLFGGNDSADIDRKLKTAVVIDGGAGDDTLRAGKGQSILSGGEGKDQLYGGSGYSILVGGAGNDTLMAGSGRTILIGGEGQDTLRGSSSDDILIGGRTAYDANEAALLAILAEWTSARAVLHADQQPDGRRGSERSL